MKMLRKIGLPIVALLGLLISAPLHQAKAAVRFGLYVGAPARAYPAYRPYPVVPAPAYVYAAPIAPAPAYAYPYGVWAGRDFHGHGDHGRDFHGRDRR